MTRITDSALEEIRQRVEITELVREYVPELKRAGRNHKARCPFHQEKTPSFMVNPDKQIFHCFGCQTGGDIFSFLMKMEGLGFLEAAEKLAARAGVKIAVAPEDLGPRERERLELRQASAFAQEFYTRMLEQSPEADEARRYLGRRGLDAATRERFGVGFALQDGSSFLQAALRKGFKPESLCKAGLVSTLEGKGRYRDFFRGRVLFPIRNTKGETVGFGGRVLGDGLPKYINSPDTALFSKGRLLYGLYEGLTETRKARQVVLLEGYMDVLAMHQFGVRNACAPLGTALTPDHMDLLKRYIDEAVLVFDPDAAGSAASLRGAEMLLEKGFVVRIVTIPGGKDPDELLHEKGLAGFEACLKSAQDLPDYQTSVALAGHPGALTAETKDGIAREVLATISKAESEIIKAEWVKRLAERLKMDEVALLSQMGRSIPARKANGSAKPVPSAAAADVPPREECILQALFMHPALALDAERVREDDFEHAGARRIFLRLLETAKGLKPEDASPEHGAAGNPCPWVGTLLGSLEPPDAALAGAILVSERAQEEGLEGLDRAVEEGRLVRRYRALQLRMDAMLADSSSRDAAVSEEYHRILKRMSELRILDRLKAPRKTGIS